MSNSILTAACRQTTLLNNRLTFCSLAIMSALLTACGGGSSSSSSSSEPGLGAALAETIEGRWQSACYVVADQVSVTDQLEFDGINFEKLSLYYADSEECSGQANLVLTVDGNYVQPGGTTQTSSGDAQHINFNISEIETIHTPALEAFLALSSTTVDEFASQQLGINDLQNPQPQDLGISSPYFSLFTVEDGQLILGDRNSNSGTSEETRLTELSDDSSGIFNRF